MSRSSGDDYILSGDYLIYYVCEIENILFDGDKVLVYGEELSKQEYRNFRKGAKELTEYHEKILDFLEKKVDDFRSQLPSYSHLQNLYNEGMSRREELRYKDPEDLTDDELIEWRIQHSDGVIDEYTGNVYAFEEAVLDEIHERNLDDRLRKEFKEELLVGVDSE